MVKGKIVVVGAGVIGLSVAWRAMNSGWRTVVVDPQPCSGASWVAGGMLAPATEAWPGEEPLLELGEASLRAWPEFAAELGDVGLRTEGTVVAAFDSADARQLEILAGHLASTGRKVDELTGPQVRQLEPTLSTSVRSGLNVPGDLAVDNRKLLDVLSSKAEFLHAEAKAVRPGAVELVDSTVDCDAVVVAAGAWSRNLHPRLNTLIRPVKGEILRLRPGRGALPLSRTIRALVESRPVYLVPRDTGEVVLGATQYEAGYNTDVTVKGVRDLLLDAERVVPGITEYVLVESAAGVRASSRDNLPVIDWLEPGVMVASGHHRNGLLLAPITAAAVVALLDGQPVPEAAQAAGLESRG
ncbi:glycine oxidase ThiO [Kibdelosporangium phytohabitans]|uniref:glycine oxidase n=1 Tax=Kibdelosporangium phytohabitans TaxID=860235 RepID=A0A0N9HVZ4_9PSEU|nr:glycine oxidase ThiO [Kibdelosporangium phytohabitans]ALG05956.1 glycine oxidase [Kibdelosporangium phytohabitans]MBE1465988.1 glycine oxidase [Kibdelosporangium phytohabitans]